MPVYILGIPLKFMNGVLKPVCTLLLKDFVLNEGLVEDEYDFQKFKPVGGLACLEYP